MDDMNGQFPAQICGICHFFLFYDNNFFSTRCELSFGLCTRNIPEFYAIPLALPSMGLRKWPVSRIISRCLVVLAELWWQRNSILIVAKVVPMEKL